MKRLLLFLFITHFSFSYHFNFECYKRFFQYGFDELSGCLDRYFLRKLQHTFNITTFIETGTYDGKTSSKAAKIFPHIHTIELHKGLFNKAQKMLQEYGNVQQHLGNSSEVLTTLLPQLKHETILFWLDAHYSGAETTSHTNIKESETIIQEELRAIKDAGIKHCVILIDDARNFGSVQNGIRYKGSVGYPTLHEIHTQLKEINSCFRIILLGDMILAYEAHHDISFSPTAHACTTVRFLERINKNIIKQAEQVITNASHREKSLIKLLANATKETDIPFYKRWNSIITHE